MDSNAEYFYSRQVSAGQLSYIIGVAFLDDNLSFNHTTLRLIKT